MDATKKSAPLRRQKTSGLLWLLLPTAVFGYLIFQEIGRRPMWRDEAATREFAMLSWSDLAKAVSHIDLVMAPYYALMHVVTFISSDTTAFRLPSAVASVMTLLLVSITVRSRWGNAAAFVAGSFLASNAIFLTTATTARAYALAALFLAAALWVSTVRLRQTTVAALWAVFCCAAVLMQLFSILVVPALVIPLALEMGWRRALRCAVIPGACAVMVLTVTHKQSSQVGWIKRLTFSQAAQDAGKNMAVTVIWPVLLIVGVGLIAGLLRKRLDRMWLTFFLATLLPPLALWAVSQVTSPVFLMRYAVFFLPALAGLIGASVGMVLDLMPAAVLRMSLAVGVALAMGWNSYDKLHEKLEAQWPIDSTATLPAYLTEHVHVGETIIYQTYHSAGGQLYGWAFYGRDTALEHDLLRELPQGRGAMLQQRAVISLHPFITAPTTRLSSRTWLIGNTGVGGPKPHLDGCRLLHVEKIVDAPVAQMQCQR